MFRQMRVSRPVGLTALVALSVAVLVLSASVARATVVEAVTFQELVKSADRIFVGEVISVESFRADVDAGRRIRTRVTFSVNETLRGRGLAVVLEFLGGTVDDLPQEVLGMPRFLKGERYVVFARDGDRWVNPVVGYTQGLLSVSRDLRDGSFRVLTANGAPLSAVTAIDQPQNRVAATMSIPMPLSALVAEIHAEMTRQAR